MDSDPFASFVELVKFGHFCLPLDLVTERPSLRLVGKAKLLDTSDLRILKLEPAHFTRDLLKLAVTVFEPEFVKAVLFDLLVPFHGAITIVIGGKVKRQRGQPILIEREAPFKTADPVLERHLLDVLELGPVRNSLPGADRAKRR